MRPRLSRERRIPRNGICLRGGCLDMAFTRRRIVDVVAAIAGVSLLIVALMVFDQRTRHAWSGADFASVGEDVNYLAVGVALLVTQVVRGEVAEHAHLLVFTAAAVVLVVLLMRL